MPENVYKFDNPVIFLGGGEYSSENVTQALTISDVVVAADSGAAIALENDLHPELVIGDFDSIDPEMLERIPAVGRIHVTEQDTTDFEKCVQRVLCPLVVGVGFTGNRLDHTLAAFSVLSKYSDRRIILLGKEDLVFTAPRNLALSLPVGTVFSLFPMAEVTGRSTGLRWPIEGLRMHPSGQIGTSNEVSEANVSLKFDQDGMLIILPLNVLGRVVQSLQG